MRKTLLQPSQVKDMVLSIASASHQYLMRISLFILWNYPLTTSRANVHNNTTILLLAKSFCSFGWQCYDPMDGECWWVVNHQWSGIPAWSHESFILKQEQNRSCYFQSIAFPHCYIRLDKSGVTSHIDCDRGVINCQYYHSDRKPRSCEHFILEEQ